MAILYELVKRLPLIRELRRHRHRAHFLSREGLASRYGVFSSFAEARSALPASPEFDSSELAADYVEVRCNRVFCYDYPVMFWLDAAFRDGARSVFDIGGSVGVHYHAYQKILEFPDSLTWLVFEVPAMARIGRELAASRNASNLAFTESLDPAEVRADVWISAGAIHYIENARPNELLSASLHPPRHVILNKLPLYDGDDFVSSQNIGDGLYAPHYVYGRQRLVADIERLGYRLRDAWDVPERDFYLPGHPERSFGHFSGLYFRKA